MIGGYLLAGLLAVCSTSVATAVIVRRRSAPTARLLGGVTVCLLLLAVSQVAVSVRSGGVARSGIVSESVWLAATLGVTFAADALWFLFCVRYTGRGSRLWSQVVGLVGGVVGLFYLGAALVALQLPFGQSVADGVATVFLGGLFFLSSLATFGSILILETAVRRNAVPVREGLTLAGGASLFVYAPIFAFNLNRPVLVPALSFGASALLAVAVTRAPVFELLPTARITARDRLIDEMDDAVVLVDERARVVELNAAAQSAFDVDAATRQRLQTVVSGVPDPATLATEADAFQLQLDDRRLSVTASRVVGEYGTLVGYLLVCRDVTKQQRRDRRLRVLTRFLTGTVGERTKTVARNADRMAAGEQPVRLARGISETTESLKRRVSATRRLERALSERAVASCDLDEVLRTVADDRRRVRLAVADTDTTVSVGAEMVQGVFTLLLETRLESTTDSVRVCVRSQAGDLVVELANTQESDRDRTPESPSATGVPAVDQESPVGGGETDTAASPAGQTTVDTHSTPDGKPTITLSRLVLEQVGASLERPTDDVLLVRFGPAVRGETEGQR